MLARLVYLTVAVTEPLSSTPATEDSARTRKPQASTFFVCVDNDLASSVRRLVRGKFSTSSFTHSIKENVFAESGSRFSTSAASMETERFDLEVRSGWRNGSIVSSVYSLRRVVEDGGKEEGTIRLGRDTATILRLLASISAFGEVRLGVEGGGVKARIVVDSSRY